MCKSSHFPIIRKDFDEMRHKDSWKPLKLPSKNECLKSCRDLQKITNGIARIIENSVTATINPLTSKPFPVRSYREEHQAFCELPLVIASKLTTEAKKSLISKPNKKSLLKFLQTTFSAFEATAEIAVMTWILVRRLLETSRWQLRATTWRSLFMVALKIAQIHEGHYTLANNTISDLYSLFTEEDFQDMSLIFLQIIDYRCFVSQHDFVTTYEQLLKWGSALA